MNIEGDLSQYGVGLPAFQRALEKNEPNVAYNILKSIGRVDKDDLNLQVVGKLLTRRSIDESYHISDRYKAGGSPTDEEIAASKKRQEYYNKIGEVFEIIANGGDFQTFGEDLQAIKRALDEKDIEKAFHLFKSLKNIDRNDPNIQFLQELVRRKSVAESYHIADRYKAGGSPTEEEIAASKKREEYYKKIREIFKS